MSEALDIDRIVHEVVRRLRNAGVHGRGGGAGTAPVASPGVLRLTDHVVTLSQLANQLDGKNQLLVSQRAVVTPSALDELRSKGVALVRDDGKVQLKTAQPQLLNVRLMIATEDNNYHAGKWASPCSIRAEYAAARGSLAQLCEIETSLARQDYRKPIGVCVTSNPHLVACEANRRTAIRAAAVSDLDGVREVHKTLDANLFVVKSDVGFHLQELLDAVVN